MKPKFVKICFVILLLSSFASTLVSSAIWQWIDPKHPKAVASKERIAQELGRRPIKCIFALERVDPAIYTEEFRIRFEAVRIVNPSIVEICQGDVIWHIWGGAGIVHNHGCKPK